MEEWKMVKGYEGLYEVSSWGRVRSLPRNGTGKYIKVLALSNDKDGYKIITLQKKGEGKTKKVHRLVADAFIPNPENKTQVNHKNGIKSDNNIKNLEWASCEENNRHRCSVLGYKGTPHHCKLVRSIENDKTYASLHEAERITGVKRQNISNAIHQRRRTKTAGGLHWEYVCK